MTRWRAALPALVPVAALAFGVPLVNRLDPSVFGVPFVMFWVVAWVAVTPLFLWLVGRLEHRW